MLGTSDAAPLAAPTAVTPPEPAPRTKPQKAKSASSHSAPVIRGMPPSTLGAQANAIHMASAQSTRNAINTSRGHYAVQIGAYGSVNDAQRALTDVQGRAGKLLAGIPSVTNPTMKGGQQVYRARFTGFDANHATSTCNALRRQAVDRFVMAGD